MRGGLLCGLLVLSRIHDSPDCPSPPMDVWGCQIDLAVASGAPDTLPYYPIGGPFVLEWVV